MTKARPTQEGGGPTNLLSPEHQLLRAESARPGEGKVIGSSPSAGPKPQQRHPGVPTPPRRLPRPFPSGSTCREGTEEGTAAPGLGTALLLRDSTAPAQQ